MFLLEAERDSLFLSADFITNLARKADVGSVWRSTMENGRSRMAKNPVSKAEETIWKELTGEFVRLS